MINPLKWWFSRNPYNPAILQPVKPISVSPELDKATSESVIRQKRSALHSRDLTSSVVTLHEDLLKLIEGKRA